jgi:hypothetical protein
MARLAKLQEQEVERFADELQSDGERGRSEAQALARAFLNPSSFVYLHPDDFKRLPRHSLCDRIVSHPAVERGTYIVWDPGGDGPPAEKGQHEGNQDHARDQDH